ncbi:MAG: T9SS type A sorting domain-containing protein, partial [Calditrichota bacterium]
VHMVVTESLDDDNADGREFYAKGNVWINGQNDSLTWPGGWEPWTESWFITMDVDASPVSDKIAVAWLVNPTGDNIYTDVWLRTSDDAGLTWNPAMNVTNFLNVDTNCVNNGGDPNVCNGDTMRPWLDVHVLIDQHDIVHLAFTCSGWFWWDYDGTPLSNHGYIWSNLWHWDSYRQEFNMIHEAWYGHTSVSLGSNNTMCHRPNLAIDTTTGYMYCSFQKFDSVQVSAGGFPSGDAWITVSTDSGRTWAEATNVSNTDGGVGTAADSCKSERDISLAKYVTNGIVHMQYMMDRDNGTSITETPEGVPTNNPMYYLRIPTTLIPTAPIVNPLRNLRADSTGFPWDILAAEERPNFIPDRFTLYQNYPNPFNPSTNIQFDLPTESVVSLRVFDVQGREVTRLLDNARLTGGAHIASFDATDFASGVYFYRLETPNASETKKMILLK